MIGETVLGGGLWAFALIAGPLLLLAALAYALHDARRRHRHAAHGGVTRWPHEPLAGTGKRRDAGG